MLGQCENKRPNYPPNILKSLKKKYNANHGKLGSGPVECWNKKTFINNQGDISMVSGYGWRLFPAPASFRLSYHCEHARQKSWNQPRE
jgi:hypothetical protein